MVRRSNRKKDLTPAMVVETSDEEFISVSSEYRYVLLFVFFFFFSLVHSHFLLLSLVASMRMMGTTFKNPKNLISAMIMVVTRRLESSPPRRASSNLLAKLSSLIQMTMTCKSFLVFFFFFFGVLSSFSLSIDNLVLRRPHHLLSNLQLERSAQLVLVNRTAMMFLFQGIFNFIPFCVNLITSLL